MNGGTEWVVDALDCDPERLRDRSRIVGLLDGIVRALELHVVGAPQVHVFPGPGGITALYLLSESHLACHTFPESGVATFNLYCCRPRPAPGWEALLADALGARRVTVTVIPRGGAA